MTEIYQASIFTFSYYVLISVFSAFTGIWLVARQAAYNDGIKDVAVKSQRQSASVLLIAFTLSFHYAALFIEEVSRLRYVLTVSPESLLKDPIGLLFGVWINGPNYYTYLWESISNILTRSLLFLVLAIVLVKFTFFIIKQLNRIKIDKTLEHISYLIIACAVLISFFAGQNIQFVSLGSIFFMLGLALLIKAIWLAKYAALLRIVRPVKELSLDDLLREGLTPYVAFGLVSLIGFTIIQIGLQATTVISSPAFTSALMFIYGYFIYYFYAVSIGVLIPYFTSLQSEISLLKNHSIGEKIKYAFINTLLLGILFSYIVYWFYYFTGNVWWFHLS